MCATLDNYVCVSPLQFFHFLKEKNNEKGVVHLHDVSKH